MDLVHIIFSGILVFTIKLKLHLILIDFIVKLKLHLILIDFILSFNALFLNL